MNDQREMTARETLKHALISILVGASVSFLTVVLQGLLNLLQHIPTELPGAAAGVITYLRTLSASRFG